MMRIKINDLGAIVVVSEHEVHMSKFRITGVSGKRDLFQHPIFQDNLKRNKLVGYQANSNIF
ncbi:hypothetical protein D3C73_1591540 [compost metagenome]